MTADQKFLKSARIVPEDLSLPTWQQWRDDELRAERLRTAEAVRCGHLQSQMIAADRKRISMWKLAAFAGWGLAAAVMFSGWRGM